MYSISRYSFLSSLVHNPVPAVQRHSVTVSTDGLAKASGNCTGSCPVWCHAHWHMEILHTWSTGEGFYVLALFACAWFPPLMCSRRGSLHIYLSILGHRLCNDRSQYMPTFNWWHNLLQSRICGFSSCQNKEQGAGRGAGLRALNWEWCKMSFYNYKTGSLFNHLHSHSSSCSFPEDLWETGIPSCIQLFHFVVVFF